MNTSGVAEQCEHKESKTTMSIIKPPVGLTPLLFEGSKSDHRRGGHLKLNFEHDTIFVDSKVAKATLK